MGRDSYEKQGGGERIEEEKRGKGKKEKKRGKRERKKGKGKQRRERERERERERKKTNKSAYCPSKEIDFIRKKKVLYFSGVFWLFPD